MSSSGNDGGSQFGGELRGLPLDVRTCCAHHLMHDRSRRLAVRSRRRLHTDKMDLRVLSRVVRFDDQYVLATSDQPKKSNVLFTKVVHLAQSIRYRLWWLIPTAVVCGLAEILGWSGRLWSSVGGAWRLDPYLMQYVSSISPHRQ